MSSPRSSAAAPTTASRAASAGLAEGHLFVGRYRLDRRIGRGGMGDVWEATEVALDRAVAVKFVHPRLARDPEARTRFTREMRSLAGVEHPNIVRLYASGLEPQPFMVMERVQGVTLRELIQLGGRIEPAVAMCYALQIAEGLGAMHRAGLSHRDVKPENILVSDDGRGHVTLVDLGIARRADAPRRDGTTDRLGTLGYIPPELVLAEPVDHRGDLYQLGVVLFETITGRKPWSDIDETSETEMQMAHAHLAPDPIRAIVPECDEALGELVERLLAKAPAQRFPNAETLMEALRAILLRPTPPPPDPEVAAMIQREMVRRKLRSRLAQARMKEAAQAGREHAATGAESRPADGEPAEGGSRGAGHTEPLRAAPSSDAGERATASAKDPVRTTVPYALPAGAQPPSPVAPSSRRRAMTATEKAQETAPMAPGPVRGLGAPYHLPEPAPRPWPAPTPRPTPTAATVSQAGVGPIDAASSRRRTLAAIALLVAGPMLVLAALAAGWRAPAAAVPSHPPAEGAPPPMTAMSTVAPQPRATASDPTPPQPLATASGPTVASATPTAPALTATATPLPPRQSAAPRAAAAPRPATHPKPRADRDPPRATNRVFE